MRQPENAAPGKRATDEKGRALRKLSPVDADLAAKETRYIPTPPRAMTKLFDARATLAGHLEKTGEAARATIPASAATPTA
jgi:hypothetical protein